jgi:hypothetical protein
MYIFFCVEKVTPDLVNPEKAIVHEMGTAHSLLQFYS